MFIKVHHVGYLVDDLDAAVEWYGKAFGGKHVGEGATALGRIAFVQMNDVEVELIEPLDKSEVAGSSDLVFHHVGYVVDDLDAAVADFKARGYKFATPEPFTNFAGYRLIYFDASSTRGTRMHLTEASSLTRN
jgi:catechol 2,3-dioxygenase-like lactoylglutathione lyase family enzyme